MTWTAGPCQDDDDDHSLAAAWAAARTGTSLALPPVASGEINAPKRPTSMQSGARDVFGMLRVIVK